MFIGSFGPFSGGDIYHMIEELIIAFMSLTIGIIAFRTYMGNRSDKIWLFGVGFVGLFVDSTFHTLGHFLGNLQLLWFTLALRSISYIMIILSLVVVDDILKQIKYLLAAFSALTLIMLLPGVQDLLPAFDHSNRFMLWIPVAILTLAIALIYLSSYMKTKTKFSLVMFISFAITAVASGILAIPSAIGDPIWLAGHIIRFVGLVLVFVGLRVR
jgi:hypothetical protein